MILTNTIISPRHSTTTEKNERPESTDNQTAAETETTSTVPHLNENYLF